MKFEKTILKIVKGIKLFGVLSSGMMIVLLAEFGLETLFISTFAASAALCVIAQILENGLTKEINM